ncbi:hypothetical protein GGR56DRAFT_316915 [Xylariaceae sp. FL0804]|nr:hypothetical protein GGR56DRAFT_316915 [Xylariaceae sp. FL0804]
MSELKITLEAGALRQDADSTIKRLYETASSLAHFRCPSTRIVGFVGDSGVGKSSLLNSLLDRRDLARTTNNGAACTCVVTEYHYQMSNEFAVEIELFEQEEIAKQLQDALQDYRHFHLNSHSMEGDERRASEERAAIAIDTFRAMFGSRLSDESFLVRLPMAAILDTFHGWVNDGHSLRGSRREVRSSLGFEECSELLMELTSVTAPDSPATWPYVKKIKVFLNAHILSKGLVLVDLPGKLLNPPHCYPPRGNPC